MVGSIRDLVPSADWFRNILDGVTTPLGFCVLLILVLFVALLVTFIYPNVPAVAAPWILGLLTVVIVGFFFVLVKFDNRFMAGQAEQTDESATTFDTQQAMPAEWQNIYGADRPAPAVNTWERQLRPALYQASYYSVPTYFLNVDLNVIDFNAAFEAVFRRIAGGLRGQHVNWFIKELANRDDVFRQGQKFTEQVSEKKAFPFIHMERIVFESDDFGLVEFSKVASQLHDVDGELCGWSVALMPRKIEWSKFESVLESKLYQDKLWSVYSGPYDRILPKFAPYNELIEEVISVVPKGKSIVGDLGAGTGNVTLRLVEKGHRVVAVENSLGMLDRLACKTKGNPNVNVVKASIENLGLLKDAFLDAVVMVNVLYALDDPIGCLREVHRMLRPGGVIGLSTTHRETRLDGLLEAIEQNLKGRDSEYANLAGDYALLEQVNRNIEQTIARRHTREEYRRYLEMANFEITRVVESTYHNAVMVLHARKAG